MSERQIERYCKYGCGVYLFWDNDDRMFREDDGAHHSIERCQNLRNMQKKEERVKHEQEAQSSNDKLSKQIGEGTFDRTRASVLFVTYQQLAQSNNRLAQAIEGLTQAIKELKKP